MDPRLSRQDRLLGLDRAIHRRDLLNGVAVAVGALMAPFPASAEGAWPQDLPGYYPPVKQGLRGNHPGAFEAAHAVRDGASVGAVRQLEETYDLVVVGAGLSGLSAAHFWRSQHPNARILILDNHDDFGGHAKRNEVVLDGDVRLMNGGTLMIDSPFPYSPVSDGLLKSLGVDPKALSAECEDHEFYAQKGMGRGLFFDKETFGQDKLVDGFARDYDTPSSPEALNLFLAKTPLNDSARADLRRVLTGAVDPWPGLSSAEKKDRLSRISYESYLKDVLKVDPSVVAVMHSVTKGEWAVGIDAVTALDCWGFGYPGFSALKLEPGATARMSFTPRGYCVGGSYRFHYPDGNASIARLLVRSLVPEAISGSTAKDIVTAKCDYSQLDRPKRQTRLRLSSTVVNVRHLGEARSATSVRVTYLRGGQAFSVTGAHVILACYNMMIPYLALELPDIQKAALHELVKEPLVYTTVGVRNWKAFEALKVSSIYAPGSYYSNVNLDPIVNIGAYRAATDPDRPTLVHLTRTPCLAGLPEHDQNRAGRAELLTTSFETFERETRSQLARMLGPGGFDPARDITALIVNRWPHGYAPERNFLWEAEVPAEQTPQVVGRQRFGRIAIANSDCGGGAYTDVAIDMAHRAVADLS